MSGSRSQKMVNQHASRAPTAVGHLIETVSLEPAEEKKRIKLKKHLRDQIVRKVDPVKDPYADKSKEKAEFLKKIQKDIRGLIGDPKKIKQLKNLSKE